MSIMGFIKGAKDKFTEYKSSRIRSQARRLEDEKIRQGKLASANAEYQKAKRDVDTIKSYNAKVESTRPNMLKNLAQGLAKAQKGIKQIKEPKGAKVSKLKAVNRGVQLGGGSIIQSQYLPSKDSPFKSGGNNRSPFQ